MLSLDMDLIRAQLLGEIVYKAKDLSLSSFDQINPLMQSRITVEYGQRYSVLRDWILNYRSGPPLPFDHFLRRLFGEVLSQPDFGFHGNLDSARVAASLIESIRKFRLAVEPAVVNLCRRGADESGDDETPRLGIAASLPPKIIPWDQ